MTCGRRPEPEKPPIFRHTDLVATLCILGATLCWGVAPVMLNYLALPGQVADGFTSNLVRYPLATALYLPLLVRAVRRAPLGRFWRTALLPTAVNLAGQTLWAMAPYYLEAGVIAFLLRTAALWGIVGAFIFFPDERRLARMASFWLGTLLAAGGFVAMSWSTVAAAGRLQAAGIVIMFFCGICYGFYGVTVRYVMGRLDPLVVFAVIGNYTSVGLIAMAPLGRPQSLLDLSGFSMGLLVISAITGITIAHGLYYVAVQRIGAAVSSLMLSVTPFVSLLVSAVFMGERFTALQAAGGTLLVAGAALAMHARQRLPQSPRDPALPERE